MKQTSTARVTQYRESQLLLGRKKREAYLTDAEWVEVKGYIKQVKKESNNET